MRSSFKQTLRKPLLPVARWLDAAGAHPNHLTIFGLLASLLAGIALAMGSRTLGIVWLLVSLFCDMLDGDIARLTPSKGSRFGAFLDSCADRVSEILVFGGLLIGKNYHDAGFGWAYVTVWTLAVAGSYMVSYTRARAEGLGIACAIGFAERPERMVLLLLLLLFGFAASGWFLLILALLTWWTVYQRVSHVARELGRDEADES